MGGIASALKQTGNLLSPQDALSKIPQNLYNASLPYIAIYSFEGYTGKTNRTNLLYNAIMLGGIYYIPEQYKKEIPSFLKFSSSNTFNIYILANTVLAASGFLGIGGSVAKTIGKGIDEGAGFLDGIGGGEPENLGGDIGSIISPFGHLSKECQELEGKSGWDVLSPVKLGKFIDCQNKLAAQKRDKYLNDQYKLAFAEESKKGFTHLDDMIKILSAYPPIKNSSPIPWSTPQIKTWVWRNDRAVEYSSPATTWAPLLPHTTAQNKTLTTYMSTQQFDKARKLIEEIDSAWQAKLIKNGYNPRSGQIRSNLISSYVQQFKNRYPIDLGSGLVKIVIDDRYDPPPKYTITISPVRTHLPKSNLSNEEYLQLATLLADGKQDAYIEATK